MGYIKRGFMPKEFDSVAFAAEVNAVSEVVESKFGYHIVKVFDKKDRHPEWLVKAEPVVRRVHDMWRGVGLEFPLEEVMLCW